MNKRKDHIPPVRGSLAIAESHKVRTQAGDFSLLSFRWGGYASTPNMKPRKQQQAKPFLKWVGGKTQLLPELEARLPEDFARTVRVYAETFVGGGALLFRLLSKGLRPERVVINDSNTDLANAWRVVQTRADDLLDELSRLAKEYRKLDGELARQAFYLGIRSCYNMRPPAVQEPNVGRAAQLIFLNRTCFNGLYRVNSRGAFNVPFGRYDNPGICDESTIWAASQALSGIEILSGDFAVAVERADSGWFVYFDPPYRPISTTSAFCDYTQGGFSDAEQRRLAAVCRQLDAAGARWMLSNSDSPDGFFDELYKGFQIDRVQAGRAINAKGSGRGKISELIVTNSRRA